MADGERGEESGPTPAATVRVVVSPLTEADEIESLHGTLTGLPGVRSAELEEYEFPTATYILAAEDPARLSRALVESPDPLIERLTRTGGTIRLELPPAPPQEPVVVVPAEPAPAGAPPRNRQRRRPSWLIADLAALALVVAVAVIALVIHAHSGTPRADQTGTTAAARPNGTASPAAPLAARATATFTVRPVAASPALTSTPAPRSPTATPPSSPSPSPTPAATATPAPQSAPAPPLAAADLVAAMRQQGLPIGAQQAVTPAAGAAVPFLSAESFQDTRLPVSGDPFSVINGGAVEVYASAQDAAQRMQELALIARAVPDAAEYDFQRGVVVLRLSRHLAQQDAQAYEAALAAATPGQ
jgi:hypothetical protein